MWWVHVKIINNQLQFITLYSCENWCIIGCGSRTTQIIRSTRSRGGKWAGRVGQGSG